MRAGLIIFTRRTPKPDRMTLPQFLKGVFALVFFLALGIAMMHVYTQVMERDELPDETDPDLLDSDLLDGRKPDQ